MGRSTLATLVSRRGVIVAVVVALAGVAGCTSSQRTTGQVDGISAGRICFTPEDPDQFDLAGCRSISDRDAIGVKQGDCISAEIPSDPDGRVKSIRQLDRDCHVGAAPTESTSRAIQNFVWLAGVPLLAVAAFVVIRRRRRRAVGVRH